jgi:hypothetical protein
MMSKFLLALDTRPALRRRVTRIFEKQPEAFSRFLAAHLEITTDAALIATEARLGWHPLTA